MAVSETLHCSTDSENAGRSEQGVRFKRFAQGVPQEVSSLEMSKVGKGVMAKAHGMRMTGLRTL